MIISIITSGWTTERTFHCKRIHNVEFSTDNNSSSPFFVFLNLEIAIINIKILTFFMHQERKYFFIILMTSFRSNITAVYEHIGFSTMTMQVNIKFNSSWINSFLQHLLRVINFRTLSCSSSNPNSVKV